MIGAIAGDIIGSVFEYRSMKEMDFSLFARGSNFTDDTVMTVAIAHAILEKGDYAYFMKEYGRRYPRVGYGSAFNAWIFEDEVRPYNSWGNGSAMRVSPVGFAFDGIDLVLSEARRTAEVSHNHPEGIKGAQATALAVYMARKGEGKERIREEISKRFGYDLNRRIAEIRPVYKYEISCQRTVPEALMAFLESESYEDAIRKAVSLGGDADTLACIAGGIAEAFYGGVPGKIEETVRSMLPEEFVKVLDEFCNLRASL